VDQVDVLHGVRVADPYRWLEDENSAEVQSWMATQNDRAHGMLAALPERKAIAARLKDLMYVETVQAPQVRKGRYFYGRRQADQEKTIVYWKQGKKGKEHVLLDPNSWSQDGSVSLSEWSVSWDGKLVAYKRNENNSDEATLYVMAVDTGDVSAIDTIAGAKYADASWTPANDGFYYTWLPTAEDTSISASDRPGYAEVRFHKLGTDSKNDEVVRERTGDATKFLAAGLSRDGRWLLLHVFYGWSGSDVYFMDLRAPGKDRAWQPLVTGGKYHYSAFVQEGRFYVYTDEDAPHYRIFRVDPAHPERKAWTEVVAERADATLTDARVLGGKLALNYLKDAVSKLEVRELNGKLVRELPLPALGTVAGFVGLEDQDEAYYYFESFTVPTEIYATSIKTGKTSLYARVKVPIDPTAYSVDQVFYSSKDGTRVSMFVVAPKGLARDGQSRLLLEGYGGFQVAQTPEFSPLIYPWLERGGVFAMPNLRGGGEYGEQWHRDGMLLKKQNVFDDFIGAARKLIADGYTRPDRLAIRGGSNGGLLMGAAMTQQPDLFAAVLCGVPLLDMVRYQLVGAGKTWTSEYGSVDDAEQFAALYAYSPYHHVTKGTKYPALLLLSADKDDRVDPMHARKFAAAMQAATSGGPVLLRVEQHSGHRGADLIKASVEKVADELAFGLAMTAGH